jgi:transcription antitermination protein NusB
MNSSDPLAAEEPTIEPRRAARLAALQALYQLSLAGGEPNSAIGEFITHRVDRPIAKGGMAKADPQLFADLVRGVAAQERELDDMIAATLTESWTVDRLETLLRLILRLGAYELSTKPSLPARVVISEYMALSDAFLGEKETALVNGLLDRLARDLRPQELADRGHGRREAPR